MDILDSIVCLLAMSFLFWVQYINFRLIIKNNIELCFLRHLFNMWKFCNALFLDIYWCWLLWLTLANLHTIRSGDFIINVLCQYDWDSFWRRRYYDSFIRMLDYCVSDTFNNRVFLKLFHGDICSTFLNLSNNDNNMDLSIYVIYFLRAQSK
jgi:hypothetical protein